MTRQTVSTGCKKTSKRHEATNFYEEAAASHTRLLPRPISYEIISQLFEKANTRDFPDNLFIKEIKTLTYLVCTHGTRIAIFVYGYFLLLDANLDLVPSCLNYARLKAAYLSNSASLMSTLGLTEDNLLVYSLLDAKLLHENYVQIKLVSTKFGMLFSMLSVLKVSIQIKFLHNLFKYFISVFYENFIFPSFKELQESNIIQN